MELRCEKEWKEAKTLSSAKAGGGRRGDPDPPKRPQEEPKGHPRPSPKTPRGIQDSPRLLQVALKTSPKPSRSLSSIIAGITYYMSEV